MLRATLGASIPEKQVVRDQDENFAAIFFRIDAP
jgi:hypothetical protein